MHAWLQRHDGDVGLDDAVKKLLEDLLGGRFGRRRIRCPRCRWRPTKASRWWCVPACGHTWNTFDTHGKCPACQRQWKVTQCLSCGRYAPHQDWYDEQPGSA